MANLFISSTFIDMQGERDVLGRLVLPRLRERFAGRLAAIREIDLRWGVTRALSSQEGAVRICFDEIERSLPLVLGMVGHRVGWCPSLAHLQSRHAEVLRGHRVGASLTSLELFYCYRRTGRSQAPTILMRSAEMSRSIVQALRRSGIEIVDDPDDQVALMRSELRAWESAQVENYASFDEFETLAERLLTQMFERAVSDRSISETENVRPNEPEIDLHDVCSNLERQARRGSVLICAAPGSGSSWLLRSWQEAADGQVVHIDGRRTSLRALDEDGLPSAAAALPESLVGDAQPCTVVFDHFEDAFPIQSSADLTRLAALVPAGSKMIVVAEDERIRLQAKAMKWGVVDLPEVDSGKRLAFIHDYLKAFGKQLEPGQAERLAAAPWASRVGLLRLALDELRRFGVTERLDERVETLATASPDDQLCEHILQALSDVLDPTCSQAPHRVIAALAMSDSGLEEEILRRVATESGDPLSASLWAALRLSLGAALSSRDGRFDLADGAMLTHALNWLRRSEARSSDIAERLSVALEGYPLERRLQDLPGIAVFAGGQAQLQRLFGDAELLNAFAVHGLGRLEAWMNLLSPEGQREVASGWSAAARQPTQLQQDVPWKLGRLALKLGLKAEADALFDVDAQWVPDRAARRMLQVLSSTRIGDVSEILALALRSQSSPAGGSADETTALLLLLGAIADGRVEVSSKDAANIEKISARHPCLSDRTPGAGHGRLAIGQLSLMKTGAAAALRHFDFAESIARQLADARLLLSALERKAAAALELRKFSSARRAAEECERLAKALGLFEFESLALERLIEVAHRRTDWADAYRLVERYMQRSRVCGVSTERASRMLQLIEADNRFTS